jgi:hypothetical protein
LRTSEWTEETRHDVASSRPEIARLQPRPEAGCALKKGTRFGISVAAITGREMTNLLRIHLRFVRSRCETL